MNTNETQMLMGNGVRRLGGRVPKVRVPRGGCGLALLEWQGLTVFFCEIWRRMMSDAGCDGLLGAFAFDAVAFIAPGASWVPRRAAQFVVRPLMRTCTGICGMGMGGGWNLEVGSRKL